MSENLSSLWLENVLQRPDATAVIEGEGGRAWSRADLQAAADRWFHAIPTDVSLARRRVALAEPNGPGWLAAFIGLLRAGSRPGQQQRSQQASIGSGKQAGCTRWLHTRPPVGRIIV